jgi:MFS family permease
VTAIVLMTVWALLFAIVGPLRQAFVNGAIPSEQRATVLSFDNLMSSAGGVIAQPALGRTADVYGYGASYVVGAIVAAFAIPFEILARREHAASDPITDDAQLEAGPV